MRAFLPCIAVALLAACSEESAPPPAAQIPPPAAAATPATALAAATRQQPAAGQADLAAAEVAEPDSNAADPCDLSGYDMSKMTVSQHEELVKACARSKE